MISEAPCGNVLFDGVRSAEPPIKFGILEAMASSTLPDATRVAKEDPAGKDGMAEKN